MTITVVKPLYARGVNRAQAQKIVRMYIHSYQPPIECAHVWKKPHRATGADHNVMLQECKHCPMVTGWVT